jgi:hypothetical protein
MGIRNNKGAEWLQRVGAYVNSGFTPLLMNRSRKSKLVIKDSTKKLHPVKRKRVSVQMKAWTSLTP